MDNSAISFSSDNACFSDDTENKLYKSLYIYTRTGRRRIIDRSFGEVSNMINYRRFKLVKNCHSAIMRQYDCEIDKDFISIFLIHTNLSSRTDTDIDVIFVYCQAFNALF